MSHDEERANGGRFQQKLDRAPRRWLDPLVGPPPGQLCLLDRTEHLVNRFLQVTACQ